MDAAQSSTYVRSLKTNTSKKARWSWGVSDDPLFIKWWFTVPNVPFVRKSAGSYGMCAYGFLIFFGRLTGLLLLEQTSFQSIQSLPVMSLDIHCLI